MRKILVIGSSGAGKTHLSRRLSQILGLEMIHLDKEYWQPGWTEPPKEEWHEKLTHLLARGSWVMDGNFGGSLEMRLAAADTAIFLELPRRICIGRVLKRWWTYKRQTRPDMGPDCDEKVDLEFLRWIWRYPIDTKPKIEQRLAKFSDRVRIIRLRSTDEIEEFVESLKVDN